MKVILLIDFSQIIYKTYFIGLQKEPEAGFGFWRYLILKTLLNLNKLFQPNEMALCCDRKSWRKEIFEHYKAGRIKNDNINNLFKEVDIFMDELETRFPYKIVRVAKSEADDIIATLIFNKNLEDIMYICSSDHDFYQLLKYDKVSMYNPTTEEFIEFPITVDKKVFNTVEEYVKDFLLHGCKGDGVPGILSDGDTFVTEGKRQVTLTQKRINQLLLEGSEKQKYDERNKRCLLLESDIIPKEIQVEIMNTYNNCKPVKNYDKIHDFLEHYQMKNLFGQENKFMLK